MDTKNMMKPASYLLTGIVILAGGFLGGMQYQRNKAVNTFRNLAGNRTGNITQMGERARTSGNIPNKMMQGGKSILLGEVTKIEDSSLTVKLPDGSSKIIILSGDTKYTTSTTSSKDQLKEGSKVSIEGVNAEGGMTTASQVQIGN